jgi:hypothetical protein
MRSAANPPQPWPNRAVSLSPRECKFITGNANGPEPFCKLARCSIVGAGDGTVKTIRIEKPARRASEERRDLSHANNNDETCIGAHADYRREDFVFARQQSQAMRQMEWESRLKPIKPWGSNLVANLAFEIFA